MNQRKVTFYPLYEETLVVVRQLDERFNTAESSTQHFTLKTHGARQWELSSLLRELADRLDAAF